MHVLHHSRNFVTVYSLTELFTSLQSSVNLHCTWQSCSYVAINVAVVTTDKSVS